MEERILQLNPKPTPKQKEAWKFIFDDTTTELGYGGGARGGKSWFGNEVLTWFCTTVENGPVRFLLGRKELKNLKRTSLVTLFKVFKWHGIKNNREFKYNQQESLITFWNGSEILLYDLAANPSDPLFLELGGLELTGALLEESNEVSVAAVNILKTRVGTWNNHVNGIKPLMIETFNPDKGHVYHRYYKPWKTKTLPKYRRFVRALPTDNPYTEKAYIEELKHADKITQERLLYGNFEYDDNPLKLMDTDAIDDLFSNMLAEMQPAPDDKPKPPRLKYITVDVARQGMDRAVIMVWSGMQVTRIVTIPKCSIEELMKTCENIRNAEQVPLSRCLADEDGVGGGLVDFWHCKGFIGNATPFKDDTRPDNEADFLTNYQNLRSQCYYALGNLVNTFGIRIDTPDDATKQLIIEECEQISAKDADKDGKRKIVSKEEIKEKLGRSPDYADTLMMRMWFEVSKIPEPNVRWM